MKGFSLNMVEEKLPEVREKKKEIVKEREWSDVLGDFWGEREGG